VRAWTFLLGGLVIWAAHFFLLYGIASVFPGDPIASLLTIAATIPAIAGNAILLWVAYRRRGSPDDFKAWVVDIGAAGAALSLIAVIWQSLPAFIA
jgi:NO-binding membrane sensor protein with MHYT domain